MRQSLGGGKGGKYLLRKTSPCSPDRETNKKRRRGGGMIKKGERFDQRGRNRPCSSKKGSLPWLTSHQGIEEGAGREEGRGIREGNTA